MESGRALAALVAAARDTFRWDDRRVLVTGATGLLGSFVVRDLQAAGALVVALLRDEVPQAHLWSTADREKLVRVRGDLADLPLVSRALNEYEVDTVFHLGAQTIVGTALRGPYQTFESNVRGTYTVLEACRQNPLVHAVIVASSDKAYGSQPSLPYTEASPLLGRAPYDASKAAGDLIAMSYAETFGLPICVTRCGNLYGPGDLNWSRLIPGTIRSALRNEAPVIRSDGRFVRDYFYVDDAAKAYLLLGAHVHATGLSGAAFNFANEDPRSVLRVVERILELVGSDVEAVVMNAANAEIREQRLSAARARQVLGWAPRFSFDQGLIETIAWYRTHLSALGGRGPGSPREPM